MLQMVHNIIFVTPQDANFDVQKAQQGIIFLDEVRIWNLSIILRITELTTAVALCYQDNV